MNRQPIYRRRRIGVALAVVALCVAGQERRPLLGTLSIDVDAVRGLAVHAEPAPVARAAGGAVAAITAMARR